MGALGNEDHERFCQAFHKRVWAGEKRADARVAAYLDTIYSGDKSDMAAAAAAVAPNARRLVQRKDIVARLAELADYAAKLAGIDSAWALVKARELVETNLADYLTAPTIEGAPRYLDIARASDEQIGRLLEISIEEEILDAGEDTARRVRKTRIKRCDPIAALALMARIGGWEAPKKLTATDPSGQHAAPLVALLREIDGTSRGLPGAQGEAQEPGMAPG